MNTNSSDRLPLVATDSQKESAKVLGFCVLACIIILILSTLTGCSKTTSQRNFADGVLNGGTTAKAPENSEEQWFSDEEISAMAAEAAQREEQELFLDYLAARGAGDRKADEEGFKKHLEAAMAKETTQRIMTNLKERLAVRFAEIRKEKPSKSGRKAIKDAIDKFARDTYYQLHWGAEKIPFRNDVK